MALLKQTRRLRDLARAGPIACWATIALCFPMGGCWTWTPPAPSGETLAGSAGVAPNTFAWPARDRARALAAVESGPRWLDQPRDRTVVEPEHTPRVAAAAPAPEAAEAAVQAPAETEKASRSASDPLAGYEVDASLEGEGLVRLIRAKSFRIEFESASDGPRAKIERVTVDTMYRFVSFSALANRPASLSELGPLVVMHAGQAARDLTAERRNRPADADPGRGSEVLWEGLAMHLRQPVGTDPREIRGLIVHLGGTNTGQLEASMLEGLLARGWAVLSMPFVGLLGGEVTQYVIQTGGRTPSNIYNDPGQPTTKPFLTPLSDEARFAITIPGTAEVFREPAQFGARVAMVTDDRLAEVAYAVEAILGRVLRAEPGLAGRPVVLMGCSAGALAAPVVAARLPGRFAAAVLIGGGSNLLELALRTSFVDARPRVSWAADRDQDLQEREALEAYAARASLDPGRTAVALRGTPTLMLHATFDAIVNAANGRELWQALGRPERWNLLGGHLGLFLVLPGQAEPIHDWLVRHVPPAAGSPGAAAPEQRREN